jgi:hypothetical protein
LNFVFGFSDFGNGVGWKPMAGFENPALKRFLATIGDRLILAQVILRRNGPGCELRQVADEHSPANSLRLLQPAEARELAQFTAAGELRPLKSAPDLQAGWRIVTANSAELEMALDGLYPGAIADWHAAQTAEPPVTHFREFTGRQSGMYRITAMLTDAQAAHVIRTGCAREFCLKRRLWTVHGLPPDAAGEKSLVPCLEPCAVLMEFARTATRVAQAEEAPREEGVALSENARRMREALEKLQPILKLAGTPSPD